MSYSLLYNAGAGVDPDEERRAGPSGSPVRTPSKHDLLKAIQDDKQYRITPVQQMISTCTGALLVSAIVTPLDVVKIRMQSQQKAMLSNRCFVYCNGLMDHICDCGPNNSNEWIKRNGKFNSSIGAFSQIIRNEGITSLWSGLPPTLIMAVPATIVYFVSYEQLRSRMYDQYLKTVGTQAEQPLWVPLIAGVTARTWAVTVVSPLELLRTKMQSKKLSYSELMAACRSLIEARGISGFWLGWGATIMRDVPFSGIYWGSYEFIKKWAGQSREPTMAFSFTAGAIAGAIAGTLTLPFDVVKTHKQIELGDAGFAVKGTAAGKKLLTTTDVLKKIYKTHGVSGLFTGFLPRLVKIAPACAIMISTYEYGKSFFVKRNRITKSTKTSSSTTKPQSEDCDSSRQ